MTASAWCQQLTVMTEVVDFFTHEGLDTVEVALLNAKDSCLVDSGKCFVWHWDMDNYCLAMADVKQPGNYLLKLTSFGYEPKYVPLEIEKLYKREKQRKLKRTSMQKASKVTERIMDGVVVQATKIKFFMNGDTLTYNADAFDLAEGSMLDALIKKLPGVELKSGGEITVNGKKVDALLLNGKNFFNSDRELILENMPAYMVKNVQTYERTPERYEGTTRGKSEQKEVVLNVKLKKEYNHGWLGNIRGGAGLPIYREEGQEDVFRYLGRIFALYYSDNGRFSAYVNVNNLNDNRQPGEDENWSPDRQATGLLTTYDVGLDGNIEKIFEHTKLEYYGNLGSTINRADNESYSNSETFLESGNTFGRSFTDNFSKDFWLRTNHDIRLSSEGEQKHLQNYWFSFSPSATYHSWTNGGNNASASFDQDVTAQLGKNWVDSISNPHASELLREHCINRTITETKGDGHMTQAGFNSYFNCAPKHDDAQDFSVNLRYNYSDNTNNNYDHYSLDYPRDPSLPSDYRNRYTPSSTLNHNVSANFTYSYAFDKKQEHSFNAGYNYTYDYSRSNQPLYLLHRLPGWGVDSVTHEFQKPLGDLPSMTEMMTTIDTDNSSWKTATSSTHYPEVAYRWQHRDSVTEDFNVLHVSCALPIKHEDLSYIKGPVDTLLARNTVLPAPRIFFYRGNYKKGTSIQANYSFSITAPDLTSMINVRDNSNPLYIISGNPNLKNTYNHNLWFHYANKWNRTLFNTSLNGSINQNQIAMGFIYNPTTGVRTVMPQNVNGNWNASASVEVDVPLLKDDAFRLKNNVNYRYVNSVDLNGTGTSAIATEATRSEVRSQYIDESLSLTWSPNKKYEVRAKGDFHYQYSNSSRENFTVQNVFDFDYGITGKVELPWDFQIATDLTMYSRRGYSETAMNTNELVWNARITKRLLRGNLLIQLDGFDLLGKLSNTRKSINAQGKTETFYNVVPSYALLHIVWKYNQKPKAKKGG